MRRFSTNQVAKKLGILQPNLQRLIRQKHIPVPPIKHVGNLRIRLWSEADIRAAREALSSIKKRRRP